MLSTTRTVIRCADRLYEGKRPPLLFLISNYFRECRILGIETSCDDTGCAIVNESGEILGEALNSQEEIHLNHGGIIPPIARDLHRQSINKVVNVALESAGMKVCDVDAIAATVKPGLPLSLLIGMNFGKKLAKEFGKPFIPIHHMEAHALTIRMIQKVNFPFLILLISGGHCLLAVARGVDDFLLLGESWDDAPGEAFDKIARRLKLRNHPEFCNMSGGAAIEAAAKKGNPLSFVFPSVMAQHRNCDFSFSGLKNAALRHIVSQEKKYGIEGGSLIPGIYDLSASFLLAVSTHICRRLQRAMEYVEKKSLVPSSNKILVVSGGVACNQYIAQMVGVVCEQMDYGLAIPPPKLCTDNGIMIAWNGVEKWRAGIGITQDLDSVDIESKCKLGKDVRLDVEEANIRCDWIKLKNLIPQNSLNIS